MYLYIRVYGVNKVIGSQFCCSGKSEKVYDIKAVKKEVEKGADIKVLHKGNFINGKEYFDNYYKEKKKTTVKAEINVVEDEEFKGDTPQTEDDFEIDYGYIFNGHWTKQVQKAQKYDDVNIINGIIEYGNNNDASQGVLKRIKKHLKELENSNDLE